MITMSWNKRLIIYNYVNLEVLEALGREGLAVTLVAFDDDSDS